MQSKRILQLMTVALLLVSIPARAEQNPMLAVYEASCKNHGRRILAQETLPPTNDPALCSEVREIERQLKLLDASDYGGYYVSAVYPYLHINVLPGKEALIPQTDNPYVLCHTVRYSLAELDALEAALRPYCADLGKYHINVLLRDVKCNGLRIYTDDIEAVFEALAQIEELDMDMLCFCEGGPLMLY